MLTLLSKEINSGGFHFHFSEETGLHRKKAEMKNLTNGWSFSE
jgi:hypothetical protein